MFGCPFAALIFPWLFCVCFSKSQVTHFSAADRIVLPLSFAWPGSSGGGAAAACPSGPKRDFPVCPATCNPFCHMTPSVAIPMPLVGPSPSAGRPRILLVFLGLPLRAFHCWGFLFCLGLDYFKFWSSNDWHSPVEAALIGLWCKW